MYQGGIILNKRAEKIIYTAGLLVPFALFVYAFLVHYKLVDSIHTVSLLTIFAVMVPWCLFAIVQFIWRSRRASSSFIRLAVYHVMSALYILLISGFMAPIAVAWVLLMLASFSFFSLAGVRVSTGVLFITAIIDTIFNSSAPGLLADNIIVMLSLVAVGLASVALGKVQEVDSRELSRSRAQESLQRDRILTIINNLADAVISTDKEGVIRIYNAASLNLLDTNISLNGSNIKDVLTITDEDGNSVDILKDLQRTKGVALRDDILLPVGDEALRLEITYSPIRSSYSQSKQSEAEDGYILIMRDVTKAKSLEEERDEFISVVSHELRTPITITEGTISNVQVMMERGSVAPEVLSTAIKAAHDQVLFLAKMVNDLSTLSRAERGVADELEYIDARDLINELYQEYSSQAEEHGLRLNLDLDTKLDGVMASRLYLKELLQNFVTNAIKYTKEGHVTVEVRRNNDTLSFAVKDTGIGMSKTDQAKIFNKFYRSEDYRTRETGGTGLGLYVATKLAKKLQTSIELTSRLNHGSTFSFSLPVSKKPQDETK